MSNKHHVKFPGQELKIEGVEVVEGCLYKKWAEDDYIYCYDLVVDAVVDGKVYRHNMVFFGAVEDENGFWHPNYNAKPEAHRLAERVAKKGIINTKYWEYIREVDNSDLVEERLMQSWSDVSDHYEEGEWR